MRISDWSSDVCSSDLAAGAVSVGNADYKRATADINYRVNDLIAFRINGMWHDQDVAGRDAIWQKRWGIAPSVTIGVDGPTKLTLAYYHLETDELPDSGFPYFYTIGNAPGRSEEHTSELQSLMRTSSAVFCLNKKKT